MLKVAVVRQEKQTFAVSIKPSDRVDIVWKRAECGERLLAVSSGKLANYAVGLMEENVG